MGDTIFEQMLERFGLATPARTTDPNDPKTHIMRDILSTKTMYDAEFDRVQTYFAPHVQHLDGSKGRQVLFIDPLKVQSAQAYGIKPSEFISFALQEKGLVANPLQVYNIASNAANVSGTAPCANPVYDKFRQNMADVVVPKSHMRQANLDIPGLKQSEITTLVNYHEFFHCLHDKYATTHIFENTPQKREMFADVGAMVEMMRRGSNPEIIDQMIVWRMKGKDDAHATVPALLALKQHMAEHGGVEGIRKLKTKDVLDLCYKATEAGSSMGWLQKIQAFSKSVPDLERAAAKAPGFSFKFSDLKFDKTPSQLLEEKAFALGGKVTPKTLMLANNALQQEYASQHEKDHSLKAMMLATMVQTAFKAQVQGTDYATVNAKRGATLTAEDQQDIDFVKKKPAKAAASTPVKTR